MFASTLDHYSARCALVSLRADHMSLPSLRVVVMSTTSVLTMWRKVFDEWNMDATPKYTKLHQFLLLCCVQCWSSMHHDCDVTPFTSCPFSLLVCAAVLRKDNIAGEGIQTPSRPRRHQAKALFWRIHILKGNFNLWCHTKPAAAAAHWEIKVPILVRPARTNIPFPAGSLISNQMDAPLNGFWAHNSTDKLDILDKRVFAAFGL